jgi:large subunit ribosomal protein L21
MTEYAIFEHGGKQYRVSPGDELLVERTQPDLGRGDAIVFERVMLVGKGDGVRIGQPTVDGAVVRGQVVAAERGDKLRVFKKKRRKGYRKTIGHRQDYYRVRVEAIEA